ncbi:MAG TPA: SCO family protein [Gemmatimonadaceae bacterium]
MTRARPGLAVGALGAIAIVTVALWMLALYPVAGAPAWLERTRLACFGAPPGALPNAGGWLVLIGEPLGLLAILLAVWRAELARDLRLLAAHWWGRTLLVATGGAMLWGGVASARVVAQSLAVQEAMAAGPGAEVPIVRMDRPAPDLVLVDQHGAVFDLAARRGQPLLVTFAYAHCQTVCPTLVQQVLVARAEAGREEMPLVVVTLDPWRDVVSRLPSIAAGWGLGEQDRVLSGEVDAVNAVLDAWAIGRWRDTTTGELDHVGAVLLVDEKGRLRYRLDGGWWRLRELLARPS